MKVFNVLALLFAMTSAGFAQFENQSEIKQKVPSVVYSAENILIGGQPSYAELELLKSRGLKTIVNLRQDGESSEIAEEEMWAKKLGLEYVRLPLSGGDINLANSKKLSKLLEGKSNVLVHCASGNRVGGLFAIDAFTKAEGQMSVEQALDFGRQRGLRSLEPKVKAVLESAKK